MAKGERKVTPIQQAILDYLINREWTGPTEIGMNVGRYLYTSASAWASPKLEILRIKGLVIKNHKGQVKLINQG